MRKKVIAIIPARGGSKSIPSKNIKDFAGRPLIYWVVKAANDSGIIDEVIVSTDSDQIRNTVAAFGFTKVDVVARSKESTLDNASSETVLLEVAERHEFEDLLFLQATNPFVKGSDIDSAYDLYKKGEYDSVFSGVPQKRFIWKKENDTAVPLNYDYSSRPMRQAFEGFLVENGVFFITSKKNLLKYKNRLSGRIGVYEMSPHSYFELDEPHDWEIMEAIFLKWKEREIQGVGK